jgi:hypothetical protein
MGGFIMLEDGRAHAMSNAATDATLRAIAREVGHPGLAEWLLSQQREIIGMGTTGVDLREIAPVYRRALPDAIRAAYARVEREGFEGFHPGGQSWAGWFKGFTDLVEMLDRAEAGEPPEEFNPRMRAVIPARGGRQGPGW